jgi:hypothetical protein
LDNKKEKTVKSFDFTVFLFAANKWKPGRGVPFFYAGYWSEYSWDDF